MKKNQYIGITFIILATLIFIFVFIINILPNKHEEQIKTNYKLGEEGIQYLLKCVQKYLPSSTDLQKTNYTSEAMIDFAVSYMEMDENYNKKIIYKDNDSIIEVNKKDILQIVDYIFDKNDIDFSDISYETNESSVFVPRNIQGGDAQVYKFKNTEYIQSEDAYVAYIDCLEIMGNLNTEIVQADEVEYNEKDVLATISLKYKIVENRKVLLAYNIEINMD